MEEYTLTVKSTNLISESTKHISFQSDKPINFKAGQFLIYHILNRKVAYSIASPPHFEFIDLCVTRVGEASSYLHTLKEGDQIKADGPYGLFTIHPSPSNKLIFVATGTGVAPIKSIILDLIKNQDPSEITLIFGVRTKSDLLYHNEWLELGTKINYIPLLSRESWDGEEGHVQDVLNKLDLQDADFYICGLPNMVTETKTLLIEKNIPKERIHHEIFV